MSRYLQLKFPTPEQYKRLEKLVEEAEKVVTQHVNIDQARKDLLHALQVVDAEFTRTLKQPCPNLEQNVLNQLIRAIKKHFPKPVYDALFTLGSFDRPARIYSATGLKSFLITGVFAALILDESLYMLNISAYAKYSLYYMLKNLVPYCNEAIASAALQSLGRQSDLGKYKSFYIVAENKVALYKPRIKYLFEQKEKVILVFLVATLMDYIKANTKAALMPFVRKYYELQKHPELMQQQSKELTISPRIFPTILAKFISILHLTSKEVEDKDKCVIDYFLQYEEDTKNLFNQILSFVAYEVRVEPCNPVWAAEVRRRFRNPKFQKLLSQFDSMVRAALHKCGYEKEAEFVQNYSTYRSHYRTLVFSAFFRAVYETLCTHKAIDIGNLLKLTIKQLKTLWEGK